MSDIKIFHSIADFIKDRDDFASNVSVGFVPTMGALHDGHATLIQKSAQENDITVLSIFVNPTQFNNAEDLQKYPRTWDEDVAIAQNAGADIIISPNYDEIYRDNYKYQLSENELSKKMEGVYREGHFTGMLTVVMKLLQIAQAHRAYFGEKDYQQLQLIKDMAATFFLRTQIIGCPTVRESDGLAMSSRNRRLSKEGRAKAPLIYKTLTDYNDLQKAQAELKKQGIEVEYLEEHYGRRFIAAFIDGVRLIDNVELK